MGEMEFRVKEVPPPKPEVKFALNVKGELFIDKTENGNCWWFVSKIKGF